MLVTFPPLYGIDAADADNPIQQIAELQHQVEGDLVTFTSGRKLWISIRKLPRFVKHRLSIAICEN